MMLQVSDCIRHIGTILLVMLCGCSGGRFSLLYLYHAFNNWYSHKAALH